MVCKLQDIITINHLKSILTKINDTFNFAVAIIDNNKKIIASSKWQKIYLELGQKNNECLKEFEKSFEEIVEVINYKIPQTLINKCFQDVSFIAIPLFIENKHYGYILAGQFFFKKPDLEFYINLAKEYGFEEKTYLKIISNLPVISKKEMENYLSFIHEYLDMSITNYKLIHTNKSYSDFDIKENKEIKNALIASEGRFKKLVESVIDYIYTVKIEKGKVISTSHGPGCVSVTGYTSEEYEKDPYLWYRMVYEEDRDAVIKQSSMMISGKQALPLEHRINHKNGFIRWVKNTPVLRYNDKHAIIGYDGLIVDITERKLVEETLKSQEEIFRLFMEYSPIYIFFKDENIRAIQLSRNYEKMLGKPLNEILGKTMDELFPSVLAESMVAIDKRILNEGKPNEVIEEFNGRIYSTLKFPIILNGKPRYLAGFTIDVTERKLAEEALKKSAEQYDIITNTLLDGFAVTDLSGHLIDVNEAYCQMLGYSKEELVKMSVPDIEIIDDLNTVNERIKKIIKYGSDRFETKHRCKDGHIIDIETSMSYYKESNNILIFLRDITERKQAEEALNESEEKFMKAFHFTNVLMAISTIDNGKYIEVNESFLTTLGYTRDEVIGKTSKELNIFSDFEQRSKVLKQLQEKGYARNIEVPVMDRNKEIHYGLFSADIITLKKEKYLLTVMADITERKKLMEIMEKDKEELKQIIDSSPIIVFYKDIEGKFIRVNKAFAEAINMPEEDFIGKTIYDLYVDEIANGMTEDDKIVFRTKKPKLNIIEQYVSTTGLRWLRTDKIPIFDKNGNTTGLIGFSQDITEQKKAEKALRESEMKYRALVENSLLGISITQQNQIIYANKALMEMFGYNNFKEYSSKLAIEYFTPQSLEYVQERRKKIERGENVPSEIEVDIIRKDAKIRTLRISIMNVTLNNVNYSYTTFIDITEQKKAEESLQRSAEQYHLITNTTMDGFAITDLKAHFIDVNDAYCKMLGYSKDELLKMSTLDIETSKSKKEINEIFEKLINSGTNFFESKHKCKDGRFIDVEISMTFFKQSGQILIFLRDITERKKAEEALRESEERFRSVFENANVGVCLVNTDSYIFKVNNMMSQIFGYSKEELEKMTVNDITYPEDKEISPKFIKKVVAGNIDQDTFDKRYIHKDGHLIWGHVSSSIIRNANGEPLYFISHVQDITERKRTEELLRTSEDRFRKIFEEGAIGIALSDKSYRFTQVNKSFCQMMGYDKEELLKLTFKDITHPEYLGTDIEQVNRITRGEIDVYTIEKKYIRKDKEIIWGALSLSALRNAKGDLINYLAMIENITERKKAESDLLESEKKFRAFVETTKEWIWMIDLKGKHTYCNPAIKSILGYEPDELIDMNSFNLIHPDDQYKVKEILEKKTEEKKGWSNLVIRWQHKDGSFRFLESNAFPILDSNGYLIGFQGADRDITERMKVEQELIKFNEELEKRVQKRTEELINVNKELESFSYTVSHDLRAPLRSINGFSQILLEDYKDKLDEEAIGYVNRIINSSNKLAELIDHLLNLSRITRSEVHKTKVDLSKMANDIIIELKELNPERIINFICEKGIKVDADYTLIHSALFNIIHNSWKYTSKKTKTKIEFGEKKKSDNRIFYIKDNGAGFDMKYSDKLFKVFQRLHSDKEFEGTGIGLATVNRIINKHGGIIWAESGINKGTTFYFTLG